ncbi:MAG: glycosyltransferase family 2 protein, partial [Rhodospirillales bacterium]|nr:glycosyltransferase family 2 protein [Rhodospirillales bacterium]
MPLQLPFDAAVVMPTTLRPSIYYALVSVFRQAFEGRVQVLIGLDRPDSLAPVEAACAHRPEGWTVQVYWPGYSTSVRHGGLSPARDGGALRCVLTHLANSPFVAYLDDDNWWDEAHLSSLRATIEGCDWAFSLRWFVHPESKRPVCIDEWESVGPGAGVFKEMFGGFVDPNCLMLDKRRCEAVIGQWNRPLPNDQQGMSADRNVFGALRRLRGAGTGQATAYYVVNVHDGMQPFRLQAMGEAWHRAALGAEGVLSGAG